MAKRAPRGEATKAETMTVRLSQKTKWGLELLARIEHQSLSAVVDRAIEQYVRARIIGETMTPPGALTPGAKWLLGQGLDTGVKAYESDRIIDLKTYAPHLVNYEEARTVDLLESLGLLSWYDGFVGAPANRKPMRLPKYDPLLVRLVWAEVKAAALDETPDLGKLESALQKAKAFTEPLPKVDTEQSLSGGDTPISATRRTKKAKGGGHGA